MMRGVCCARALHSILANLVLEVSHNRPKSLQVKPLCAMQEIDFVASDLSLEIIGDFAIVWLLSPRKSFRPLPRSVLGRVYKALPGHALQARLAVQGPGGLGVSPTTLGRMHKALLDQALQATLSLECSRVNGLCRLASVWRCQGLGLQSTCLLWMHCTLSVLGTLLPRDAESPCPGAIACESHSIAVQSRNPNGLIRAGTTSQRCSMAPGDSSV